MAAEFTSFATNWRGGSMQHDLWRYACDVYARPGVEAACLQAQDGGADVCLALCAVWLEHRRVEWSVARGTCLSEIASSWSSTVITPLRALRQQWRDAARDDPTLRDLRENMKRLELEAEQALLQRLQAAAGAWPSESGTKPAWLEWAVPDATARLALSQAANQR